MVYDQRFEHKLRVFAQFATDLAELSTCKRLQIGCVIFPRDFTEVLAIGYNGPPSGFPNDGCGNAAGLCGCVHAEANALVKLSTTRDNLVLYTTHSPCPSCASLIINSRKIAVVAYTVKYRDLEGLAKLQKAKIQLEVVSA